MFEETLGYGDVHLILHLWKELRHAQVLRREAAKSKAQFDIEAHIKTLVVNRLCDPSSKMAQLAWLEHVYLPGVDLSETSTITSYELWTGSSSRKRLWSETCAMLMLFDQKLDLVFYDFTSFYFETELTDELRKYGYSRYHRGDRPQVTVGMVTTRDGISVGHHVFPGNTVDEATTVREVVRDRKSRFPIAVTRRRAPAAHYHGCKWHRQRGPV